MCEGPKSKQMAHSSQDNPGRVYLQKGLISEL
jgi:hypothetical protein